jgi:hypothetical protein
MSAQWRSGPFLQLHHRLSDSNLQVSSKQYQLPFRLTTSQEEMKLVQYMLPESELVVTPLGLESGWTSPQVIRYRRVQRNLVSR